MTEEEQIEYVKGYWTNIREIRDPSEPVQLAAVSKFPMSINYITNPTLQTQIAALRYSGTTIHGIRKVDARVFDDSDVVDTITKSLLLGMRAGYFDSVNDILNRLDGAGASWPALETIRQAITRQSISESQIPLIENLGTLSELQLGKLLGLIRQPYINSRKYVNLGNVNRKFQYWYIGSRSEIVTIPVTRDLGKTIKKQYKQDVAAAAVYLNNTPVLFTITDEDSLRGRTRPNPVAYDLSSYADDFREAMKTIDKYHSRSTTTFSQEEERDYDVSWELGAERPTKTKYYAGTVLETQDLMNILAGIEIVAKKNSAPIVIKLVKKDIASSEIRRKRHGITPGDILATGESLKIRLAKYKNAKRPTAATIQDFITMALQGNSTVDVIRFAGTPYTIKNSSYEKLDPINLLRGKPFSVRYSGANPGEYYQDVVIKFQFNKDTNMLIPYHATWSGDEGRGSQVLDPETYLRVSLGVSSLDKQSVMKTLLTKVKSGGEYSNIEGYIGVLKDMGVDWPELDKIASVIKKTPLN